MDKYGMGRSERVGIRVSPEEKNLIEAAAKLDHRRASDWSRLTLLWAAKAAIEKAQKESLE